jgi:dTDP-4-dehydrorhamnose reductase
MSTDTHLPTCNPAIWGGIECTINRIGNSYRDQLKYTGHYDRPGDIERFAALGITALRYPVLWERHQPMKDSVIDWSWAQQQLTTITANGMRPVVGLVHHGSGPSWTRLDAAGFAGALSDYAQQVAARFPWLEYYTPVNEPLTTARFSGLYGLWYPHRTDARGFATMLLNQLKAVVLSMQAIRRINPAAKLVQTEDIARVHSTPLLQYQADFENQRRWLTFDLLCGRVNKEHALWSYFTWLGIGEADLAFFEEHPCVPDVVGLNYYVTSERYLDESLAYFPAHTHGGNAFHRYADVEAVRVGKPWGLEKLIEETWQRYRLPIAITEAHLSCDEANQMRWFKETWDACCAAAGKGIPVKAVTAWALLGAYDWDSLLTQYHAKYETGVFDVSNNRLQPSLTASLIASLAKHGYSDHPILAGKGWWQCNDRFIKDIGFKAAI